jgi:hypothetical protein|tara:strand:+ start:108 stop:212 length:105 start_codon:yes stop_codon:yes gene_type:complete
MIIAKAASKKIFDLLFSAHGKKNHPPTDFHGFRD